ncbi:MAG: histidinol-phosphate transaminase [Dehalococcoidales bacterium]|nr:histidinol-phosphate transaminase [Dehalococcoidales bacterium]
MAGKDSIKKYIRPDLANFGGYSARISPDTLEGKVKVPVDTIIKLDANENPYGCSPAVSKALASYDEYYVYPDDGQTKLRKLLAGYCGVDEKYIVAGGGSNQLIDLILRLFLNQGEEVINCVPTFGIYKFSTDLCSGKLVEIPRNNCFDIDVATIKAAVNSRTKVIFLANPNNPTGNIISEADIRKILDTDVVVVVDEAYYEFSRQTVVPLVKEYGNLIVLRTFSKWAGLAGLRVGYGLFPPEIADYILKIKIPYNVNAAAMVAVEKSLRDIDYLQSTVRKIIDERERLFTELEKISWLKPFPSQANFILCKVEKGNALQLRQNLQEKGILIRYYDDTLLRDYVRISVGKPEHTDALMNVLRAIS